MGKIVKNLDSVTRTFGGLELASGATSGVLDSYSLTMMKNDGKLINALTETTPEAGMIDSTNESVTLTGILAVQFLFDEDAPKDLDRRAVVHNTARYLGTYTYFTSADDDHTDPHAVGGTSNINELHWEHAVSGDNPEEIYLDFNTIINDTYIREGELMFEDANQDYIDVHMVPQLTSYTSGSNTNFNLYGGYLIIPAVGDGTITVDSEDMVLVKAVPNEYGQYPAAYWDADWNTTTKSFDNITPNYTGEGEYNMFGAEVNLFTFMNRKRLLGTGAKDFKTEDSSMIGHGMRVQIHAHTQGTDHAWKGCGTLTMYRKKTC